MKKEVVKPPDGHTQVSRSPRTARFATRVRALTPSRTECLTDKRHAMPQGE